MEAKIQEIINSDVVLPKEKVLELLASSDVREIDKFRLIRHYEEEYFLSI